MTDFSDTELPVEEFDAVVNEDGEALVSFSLGSIGVGILLTSEQRRQLSNALWIEGDDEISEEQTERMLTEGELTNRYILNGYVGEDNAMKPILIGGDNDDEDTS